MGERIERRRETHGARPDDLQVDNFARQQHELGLDEPKDTVITRRGFLKYAGKGLAGAAAIGTGVLVGTELAERREHLEERITQPLDEQYDLDGVVREAKAYLRTYGLDLLTGGDTERNEILGDKAALEHYQMSLLALVQEISKYPQEMIPGSMDGKTLEIRVVNVLSIKDRPNTEPRRVGGVATTFDRRAPRIGLDSSQPEEFQRQTIHHELNHLFGRREQQARDIRWRQFHASLRTEIYRPIPAQRNARQAAAEEYFLTNYAGTEPIEDQAVWAEHMMVPELHLKLIEKIRSTRNADARRILTMKYMATKEEYRKWSNGVMDDQYWQRLIQQTRQGKGDRLVQQKK